MLGIRILSRNNIVSPIRTWILTFHDGLGRESRVQQMKKNPICVRLRGESFKILEL